MSSHMKQCPYCKEAIKVEAVKCRFCGEFLEVPKAGVVKQESEDSADTQNAGGTETVDTVDSEEETTTIRLSKICMLGKFLMLVVINVVFGGIAVLVYLNPTNTDFLEGPLALRINFGVAGAIVTIALLRFALQYFQFRAKVYKVSIDRIECRSGLFSRTINNIETWRVQDVKLEQPLFQRIFGAGMVVIESTDPGEPHLEIGPIGNAEENYQAIRKFALEADRRRGVVHLDQ